MQPKSLSILAVCAAALALLLASVSGAVAQSPAGTTVPYSSRLTDDTGRPLEGVYAFTFALYDAETGGRLLWSETHAEVAVKNGDLALVLGEGQVIPKDIVERKELWLAVSVRGPNEKDYTLLNPRQRFTAPASPSALACPHTHFTDYWGGTNTSYGLEVDNSTGTGDGVRGYSGATAYNYAGVYAINGGGTTAGDGGTGAYASSLNGYGGYFESSNYRALYAKGNSAWYAAYIENPAGSINTGLYVNGTMWVTGAKTGFVTDAALNDGPEPLETGDVVVITGAAEPLAGQIPVIRVRKATAAGSAAVAGVVDQGVGMQKSAQDEKAIPGVVGHAAHLANNTAIQPGEYLLIVTLGAFNAVKVDATAAPIAVGDLLVASSNPGYAMVSDNPKLGSVIGKALSEWKSGAGVIAVLVTLK
jgi:hypothetical protein